jgi:hypothetical protein
MTDRELIGYCRLHCKTERALFSADHVNRMLKLAGHPAGYVQRVDGWLSAHEEMTHLCDLAEKRLADGVQDNDQRQVREDSQGLGEPGRLSPDGVLEPLADLILRFRREGRSEDQIAAEIASYEGMPCPRGANKPEPTCTNRHQCWEPCGELGKSAERARPVGVASASSASAENVTGEKR